MENQKCKQMATVFKLQIGCLKDYISQKGLISSLISVITYQQVICEMKESACYSSCFN